MSDYLWDKTGEPDEEVERLEALLGGFGHTPRPLALPAPPAPGVRRRSWLLAPAGLAAAAGLVLAVLAGAFVLLRPAADATGAAASGTLRPSAGALVQTSSAMLEPPPGIPRRAAKDERVAAEINVGADRRGAREMKGAQSASLPGRRQRPAAAARVGTPERGGGLALETMSAGVGGERSLFEGARLMTKEQLVYALRLTGAKLRDVSLRTQGRDGSESHAVAPR